MEALIGILLASIGIAALVSALGFAEKAESLALDSERMQNLAQSKLEETLALKDFTQTNGDFSDRGLESYTWDMSSETTSVGGVSVVTVTVQNTANGRSQEVETLFYQNPETSASP